MIKELIIRSIVFTLILFGWTNWMSQMQCMRNALMQEYVNIRRNMTLIMGSGLIVIIPWFMSIGIRQISIAVGWADFCPPKLNGKKRPEVRMDEDIPGATNSLPHSWQTSICRL